MVVKEKNNINKEKNNNKNLIIVVALIVLVIVATVQAVQLFSLKGKLNSGQVSLKAGSATSHVNVGVDTNTAAPTSSSGALPQMVGGC